jgi:hypothetical protein
MVEVVMYVNELSPITCLLFIQSLFIHNNLWCERTGVVVNYSNWPFPDNKYRQISYGVHLGPINQYVSRSSTCQLKEQFEEISGKDMKLKNTFQEIFKILKNISG